MPKKRLTQIINEVDTEFTFKECLEICNEKLDTSMLSGKGKNTWINESGQEILKLALLAPEIVPKHMKARVIRLAPNPSYVYAILQEKKTTVPVVVPRRFQKSMLGKKILLEEISDATGSSFRYVKEKLFHA